jgi:hypothetical protein
LKQELREKSCEGKERKIRHMAKKRERREECKTLTS